MEQPYRNVTTEGDKVTKDMKHLRNKCMACEKEFATSGNVLQHWKFHCFRMEIK